MMLPQERIPLIIKKLAYRKDTLFRFPTEAREVYLTFDDGPIPESTPWLLDILNRYDAEATFFMVADNARRYPALFDDVISSGHTIGNHTYHHVSPFRQSLDEFKTDLRLADSVLDSKLFRPPHGIIRLSQQDAVRMLGMRMVMFDLNTLDYRSDRDAAHVEKSVKNHVRPGCIINMHDSLKSIDKLKTALPRVLAYLRSEGYEMKKI